MLRSFALRGFLAGKRLQTCTQAAAKDRISRKVMFTASTAFEAPSCYLDSRRISFSVSAENIVMYIVM